MSLIEWDNSLSVQVAEIDGQHKQLIATINKLHAAMSTGDAAPILEQILSELSQYIKTHFATEEKYFKEFNYELSEEHIKEHKDFEQKIEKFIQDFKSNKLSVPISLLNFLHRWFIDHLEREDQKYIKCFKEHGLN